MAVFWLIKSFRHRLSSDNLQIIVNIIDYAYKYGAKKLLYLARSCCYPKHAKQPTMPVGKLEPTNQAYAMAKTCRHRDVQIVPTAVWIRYKCYSI